MLRAWLIGVCSFSVFVTATSYSAQLPPSQKLSAEDIKGMTQEIDRLERLRGSANDKNWIEFEIARTYAAGGQYPEAVDWLQRVVNLNLGFDPSRDQLFANLRGTKEFGALIDKIRSSTPPVSNSRTVTTIPETDLFPENFAYDPMRKTFFIGSTFKDEIVRCPQEGLCEPFVAPKQDGLGHVLGLKIHQLSKTLWVTSNTDSGASLYHYSLSGKLIHSYPLSGAHLFNDLVVLSSGEVFVTDTKEGSVYQLSGEKSTLKRVAPKYMFTAANGIALSLDERRLFVASFPDGITVIDLPSESAKPMPHSANVCLAYIDGLYALGRGLIAIQNGPMTPRIIRFTLGSDASEIVGMEILEQRNSLFDGLTTGTVVGNYFYYIANNQIDKIANGKIKSHARLDPLQILAVYVGSR